MKCKKSAIKVNIPRKNLQIHPKNCKKCEFRYSSEQFLKMDYFQKIRFLADIRGRGYQNRLPYFEK